MSEQGRIRHVHELEPGTYVFEVDPGPRGGTLTLADGREITIGKRGGSKRVRIQEPQKVVISYEADGRTPSGINLKRLR